MSPLPIREVVTAAADSASSVTVTPPMSASHARPASFEQEVEVGRSSEDATS